MDEDILNIFNSGIMNSNNYIIIVSNDDIISFGSRNYSNTFEIGYFFDKKEMKFKSWYIAGSGFTNEIVNNKIQKLNDKFLLYRRKNKLKKLN